MITDDIPNDIRDCLASAWSITEPKQGLTADVAIVASGDKRFILKHSTDRFAQWLRTEFDVMLALERTPVPTARVHRFVDVQGDSNEDCWLLIDCIPGEQLAIRLSSPELPRDERYRLFRDCGAALATVHAVPPPPCLTNCSSNWLDALISSAGKVQANRARMFDKDKLETQARHEALLKIEQTRPPIERFTLIHGDCSVNNIIFDGTNVSLIDWGCATIGDPRYDIAQVLWVDPDSATAEMSDDIEAFFEGYGADPVPIDIIRYYQELYDMGGQGCVQAMPLRAQSAV